VDEVLSSRFDVNDLGEASFVLGIDVHRDKRKRGIRTIAKHILEKRFQRSIVCMRVSLRLPL
jgi:hypothetical protein